jgi:hypothetical protein
MSITAVLGQFLIGSDKTIRHPICASAAWPSNTTGITDDGQRPDAG